MSLTETQLQQVDDWFRDRKLSKACPCGCKESEADLALMPKPVGYQKVDQNGPTFHVVTVTCRNCASVRAFCATTMGLWPPPPIPEGAFP